MHMILKINLLLYTQLAKIIETKRVKAGLYQNYFGFSGGDVKQPKNKGKMAAATKGFFAPGCGF